MRKFSAAVMLSLGALAFSVQAASEKLSSGVVVEHVKPGAGAAPVADSVVEVHYRGTLADGTEFDSSYKRNQSAIFPLTNVVPCFRDGIVKMKVGESAKLTCPPQTAYGERGVPGTIPPNSTLTFEVQLISIKH